MRRVLFVGTCRIYRSSSRMFTGTSAVCSPHRVHTPRQILDVLRYHNDPEPARTDTLHARSRECMDAILDHGLPAGVAMQHEVGDVRAYDAYVIEVSSLKEHFARLPDGGEILVNSLVEHDTLQAETRLAPYYADGRLAPLADFRAEISKPDEVRAELRKIKNYLGGKPIVWVSHANILEPSPAEASLHQSRERTAALLRTLAPQMADEAIDPTDLVRKVGRQRLFANRGADLVHYTDDGQVALARLLREALDRRGV